MSTSPPTAGALDRARAKAYVRLLPLLFLSYVIAYVDRVNVGFAKLDMQEDLAPLGFSEGAFGFGMGVFFIGYLVLEIPGTLIVEKWSARKWICRIMVSWGIVAAMTAFVHYRVPGVTWLAERAVGVLAALLDPLARSGSGWLSERAGAAAESLRQPGSPLVLQFFSVRFLLGLAEAGFYPGVIVYLTHWFPRRDRTKALAWFFIGTPIAQVVGPPISGWIMAIGKDGSPPILGLVGWQWVFITWGIPAVVLGLLTWFYLIDRPRQAPWLTEEEREALESTLAREKQEQKEQLARRAAEQRAAAAPAGQGAMPAPAGDGPATHAGHMTIGQALLHPKVLALAAAYYFVVTGSYGVELYMASIFKDWYSLEVQKVSYLIVIPALGALVGQLLVGWNSDRTHERRWHASLPIVLGAATLALVPGSRGTLWLTVVLFTLALVGVKSYLPAFWALPSLFLTESAAAASIGLINSFGNLGGMVGPSVLGIVKQATGTYRYGLWFLSVSVIVSAMIIVALGIGGRPGPESAGSAPDVPDPEAGAVVEPA
jgi:ACS family tartrate transporter-like MFS transporter